MNGIMEEKMRIHELLHFFKTYFLFGVMGLILLALLGAFGYYILYKRILKGNKKFSKKQVIFGGLFIAYVLMVFGVTFLSRGAHFQGSMNTHFLSSYREAWNSFNLRSWQFIILNIFMFVPFGFLLPLLQERFHKIYNTLIAALLFTIFIELIQLKTGVGIFELDDIFNNVLGALIGHGIIMSLLSIIKSSKRKGLKVIGFLSPLIMTLVVFISIFTYYENKELGNIPQAYIYKISLKNTNVELNASLKDNKDLVQIYKAPVYTKEESTLWVSAFFKSQGIDASNIEIDAYSDNSLFWRRGEPTYSIRFDYVGGTYRFTDFSSFDEKIEPMNIEENVLIDTLGDFGIKIPKEAELITQNKGSYQWEVDKLIEGDTLLDGAITCTYFNDHTIKALNNNLITYTRVKEVSIISEKEAFEALVSGKFRYYDDKDIENITIRDISLEYILDTKGFYQPAYSFASMIDGNDYSIIVPAIK